MKIGYRTLKTAIAAPIAVLLAELLQLDHSGSAAIIAVLCIQPTRKQSFLTAWHRIAAGLLSIIFAYFIFEFLGYTPLTVGILLITFIPVTNKLNITPGIITSLVILFHFYAAETVDIPLIINEVSIMFIGIGLALLLNLYMPSLDQDFQDLRRRIESNYQTLFSEIAKYLRGEGSIVNVSLIEDTKKAFQEASELLTREKENTLHKSTSYESRYFSMREMQLYALSRITDVLKPQMVNVVQARQLSYLFEDLADAIYPNNPVDYHIEQIKDLKLRFEAQALPKTREEFETRADLFQLLNEIDYYLNLKHQSLKDIE